MPLSALLLLVLPACSAAPASLAEPPSEAMAGTVAPASASRPAAPPAQDPQPAEGSLDWYLPADAGHDYDPAFPKPSEVLGWEVGTWHVRHDQLVQWFERVAAASPRVQLTTYGHTHEQRPLLLAAVSSPANLERLDDIRRAHVEAVRSGARQHDGPEVVWMGYSVHGNESSGSNAAILFAYHLAAARGQAIERFLDQTVVLIDPCLNPDGLARFAHWANMHKGKVLVGDPNHREHDEGWPSGRTNHYWFDLNRDWLLLTHPESQARVAAFQDWLPTVLTDYHEMGAGSSYFFQPGIPSRRNPLTPVRNEELTRAIAERHAEALDELGSLYFTEESFDDFYYGKGSTYPDLHGGVGILFEQASSRGHLQENDYGGISFPFTIRNQLTTSLSTLRAVDELRGELSAWQRAFYREARAEARASEVAAWIFGAAEDPARTRRMVEILRAHAIEVVPLAEVGEHGEEWAVPADQPQYRVIRSLFETRTSWPDNTFYDVSTWHLPSTFGVPCQALDAATWSATATTEEDPAEEASFPEVDQPVAWIFDWHDARAPRALQRLLAAGVRVRVATKTFTCETADGPFAFDYGAIVVTRGMQELDTDALRSLMRRVAEDGVQVHAAMGGLTPVGIDLGSRSLEALEAPSLALVVDGSASSYEAGEVWHELDTRIGMPVTLLEQSRLGRADLDRYTHLVLVNGAGSGLGDRTTDTLRAWVRDGGTLIATKSSAVWAVEDLLGDERDEDEDARDEKRDSADEGAAAEDEAPPRYEDYEHLRAEQNVAGTIFRARLDRTHPLGFGYLGDELAVFRNHERTLPEADDPFAQPLRYTDAPLVSGFASEQNVDAFRNTPAARVHRYGGGTVVALIDNPLFRGVWWGTRRLFLNAIYFGPVVKRTGPIDSADEEDDDAVEDHGHQH